MEKPWGYELIWARTDRYAGKVLHVEGGHQLSFQYHERKDETICLLRGLLELEVAAPDGPLHVVRLTPGESFHIPAGLRHRLRALETSDILEASSPELTDLVRLEDAYGREGSSTA